MAIGNGRISATQMRLVDGWALLAPGAAAAWLLFAFACQMRWGIRPTITSPDGAYRSYARQLWWWVNRVIMRVVVAFPGTSNHGLGMAIDVYNWARFPRAAFVALARQYGFEFDTPSEHWHMRYTRAANYTTATSTAGGVITKITEALTMNDYLYLFVPASGATPARYLLLSVTQLQAPIDTTSVTTAENWTLAIPGLNKATKVTSVNADRAKVMSVALRAEYLKAKAQERAAA